MLDSIKKFFHADVFARSLGIEIEEAKDGRAVCSMKKREDLLNANGVIQGGALYTLGDFVFAVGAASTGKLCVTSNLSMSYLRPAKGDYFRAIATPVHLGRTLYTYDVVVLDGDKTVAKLMITGCVLGDNPAINKTNEERN